MKLKNYLLSMLMVIGSVSPNLANATDWDWGGYVPTADSPVVGGFALNEVKSCQSISTGIIYGSSVTVCAEDPARFGVVAFGKVAYTGNLSGGQWYGGSFANVTGSTTRMSCPANTAPIKVVLPYPRSDGVSFNPYVYSYPWGTMGAYSTSATLCVKTDTTP